MFPMVRTSGVDVVGDGVVSSANCNCNLFCISENRSWFLLAVTLQ